MVKNIFVLAAYAWEAAPCSFLPTADENAVAECSDHTGDGDSSRVRALIERSGVQVPAGVAGEFYSPVSTLC